MLQNVDGTQFNIMESLKDPENMRYFREVMKNNMMCSETIRTGNFTIRKVG